MTEIDPEAKKTVKEEATIPITKEMKVAVTIATDKETEEEAEVEEAEKEVEEIEVTKTEITKTETEDITMTEETRNIIKTTGMIRDNKEVLTQSNFLLLLIISSLEEAVTNKIMTKNDYEHV